MYTQKEKRIKKDSENVQEREPITSGCKERGESKLLGNKRDSRSSNKSPRKNKKSKAKGNKQKEFIKTNSSEAKESEDNTEEDVNRLTIREFVDKIVSGREDLVRDWHEEATQYPFKIDSFLDAANGKLNRFGSLILYDANRVKIKDRHGGDYYHASYVDSYEEKGGYILAQAPFDDTTEIDFWRMVVTEKPMIIIVNSSICDEERHLIMKDFWPFHNKERSYINGAIRVRCLSMEKERDHDTYEITVITYKGKLNTQIIQNRKWVDDNELPTNILDFRATIKIAVARAKVKCNNGPLMFVCPSGVHRCGTFAALNILLDRLSAEKKVGLDETIAILKEQRYGCLSIFDHYKALHDTVVRQAVSLEMVQPGDVARRNK